MTYSYIYHTYPITAILTIDLLQASQELVSSISPTKIGAVLFTIFNIFFFPFKISLHLLIPAKSSPKIIILILRYYAILLVVLSVSSLVLAAPICKGDVKWAKPRQCKPVDPAVRAVCILTFFLVLRS